MLSADFIVVGAGIAGASAAHFLAAKGKVVVVEREAQPGYHTTGRSAALFLESYGPPPVQALTRASRAFFDAAVESGFCERPLLSPRGTLLVAAPGQEALLEAEWQSLRAVSANVSRIDADAACALFPALRRERVVAAIHEAGSADIDVASLLQGYLRGLRRQGGSVHADAEVRSIERRDGVWSVRAGDDIEVRAPVLVNAAGAWCDEIGRLAGAAPIGLEPRRRSAFVFAPPEGVDVRDWPAVAAIDESWYVKPDAGLLLGSPANADPTHAQDVQPDELDIAVGIDRIEAMTTFAVRPKRRWAGLRSFVADGSLVCGFDARVDGFLWVAGQGGYGIQTSPAMGQACAALACGEALPPGLLNEGVTAAALSPARLGRAATP